MSTEISNNPQIDRDDSINSLQTEEEKIDQSANEAATKASRVQRQSETSDTVGGVRSNSGGLFTK